MPNTREKLIELLQDDDCPLLYVLGENIGTLADYLISAGLVIPVRCKDCKHWSHMEDGYGDCTNGRFHLSGHADPTMKAEEYCCLGERKEE